MYKAKCLHFLCSSCFPLPASCFSKYLVENQQLGFPVEKDIRVKLAWPLDSHTHPRTGLHPRMTSACHGHTQKHTQPHHYLRPTFPVVQEPSKRLSFLQFESYKARNLFSMSSDGRLKQLTLPKGSGRF